MPNPSDFIQPMSACMSGNVPPGVPFQFPNVDVPGLPAVAVGAFGSMLAGVNYCLDYLPPRPDKVPEIPGPTIFIEGFLSSPGLPGFNAFSAEIPGGPTISIPGHGVQLENWDGSGFKNMLILCVGCPYLLIRDIVGSIIELNLKLPSLAAIEAKITDVGISVGIPAANVALFSGCLAGQFKSILNLLA